MTDEQLSALLRLKRYEQPPAHYFDRLLQDIHRRQRADLLQLPLWRIAAERLQTFFGEHSMGHVSYAGALASVLVVGATAIGLMTPGGTVERFDHPGVIVGGPTPSPEARLTLGMSEPLPALGNPALQTAGAGFQPVASPPRYVIDARPVSYEPSSSINF